MNRPLERNHPRLALTGLDKLLPTLGDDGSRPFRVDTSIWSLCGVST